MNPLVALRIMGLRARGEAQFRFSFVSFAISQCLVTIADLVVLWGLFSRVDALGGWTGQQVLFLFAVGTTGFGVADTLFSPLEYCEQYVKLGTFDQFMVRPLGLLAQVCSYGFELRRAGKLISGPAALVGWLAVTDLDWTPTRSLFLVAILVAATVSFAAMFVSTNAITFWLVNAREVSAAFTYGGRYASQFPTDVLATWLRRIVLFATPISAVAYLPGLWLLDAANPLGVPRWVQLLAPLHCVVVAGVAALIWRSATRRYQSTGS